MLLYTTLGTNDIDRAARFYDATFAVLGQRRRRLDADGWAAWGEDYDGGFGFWLCPPFDGQPVSAGNGTMFAFRADSAAQVRAWYAAGLAHGGSDEGGPGTRPYYEPTFYVAYLRDPDGHKLACVFHRYEPAADQ